VGITTAILGKQVSYFNLFRGGIGISDANRMFDTIGGFSTIVASFLARMRGSGEPERSQRRIKDLDQFIRDCEAFQMDRGHLTGSEEDQALEDFRKRFEELLGNTSQESM